MMMRSVVVSMMLLLHPPSCSQNKEYKGDSQISMIPAHPRWRPACYVCGGCSHLSGAYAGSRLTKFLTFDTCHRVPRALRTPRLFDAAAMPRRARTPEARSVSMMGRTLEAKAAASAF